MSSEARPVRTDRAAHAGALQQGQAVLKRLAANDVLLATLALSALIIIFFYDIVFLGRTLVTSPFLWGVMGTSPPFGYPGGPPDYNIYLLDPLASGVSMEATVEKASDLIRNFEVPLWDSNIALGRPFLGTMSNNVVSPIRAVLILWPSQEMWDLFLLARFLVAGLFTYLLARRLALTKIAAFGAAVAFSFSGFFMLYINMPHPDYAMMIPVLLYSFELLQERASGGRIAFAAAAVTMGILADNPESAVLLLIFGAAYYFARALSEAQREGHFSIWRRIPPLAFAMGTGVGLTAFTVLPFIELTGSLGLDGLAVHRHTPDSAIGVRFDAPAKLISLFVPYFDGPPVDSFHNSGWTGIRNYVGVVVPVLAIVGLWNRPAMAKSGLFFLGAAFAVLGKTYGVPVINLVGHLPVLNVIGFGLYLAPFAGFSIAMLAGLGLDQLTRADWRWRHALVPVAVVGAVLGWLVWLNRGIIESIPDSHLIIQMGFAGALIVAAGAVLIARKQNLVPIRVAPALLVALIVVELFAFTTPTKGEFTDLASAAYARDDLPILDRPERYDPFTKPPYVDFLQNDTSKYRVFGSGYVLYPNSSRVYNIDDVRGFTATTVQRYFLFIRRFINPSMRSRFTGAPLPPLGSETEPSRVADNPMFDLLNIKYILTPRGLPQAYDYQLTESFLTANETSGANVRADVFGINGEDDIVLFQHPPNSVSYTFTPNEESQHLLFRLAMDPEVWQPDMGDGVQFKVSLKEGGDERVLFSKSIDPKNNPDDRRWIDGSVDLEPYLGESVTLILSTSPMNSAAFDWAGWGGLRLAPSPDTPPDRSAASQFELVYDGEVKIYENHDALPRAFIVHEALPVAGQDAAISLMQAPSFDPSRQAVIEGNIPELQLALLPGDTGPFESSVEITSYKDTHVELAVRTAEPGLLVLSDTYYPGWDAYVDGEKTPIYPTDLAIRSIFIPAGDHKVEFVFSPDIFKLGSAITMFALAALILYAVWVPASRTLRRLLDVRRGGR